MNRRFSARLAETCQGQAYYCACRDSIALSFKGRWFAIGRDRLAVFRENLSNLLNNSALVRGLVDEALEEARMLGVPADTLPTVADLGEMLGLVDSATLVLEAQEIAGRA